MKMVLLMSAALLAAPLQAQEDPEALVAMLRAGSYAELDARVGRYQAAYEKNADAEWPLITVIGAFGRVEPDLERHHDAWIESHPNSYVARLARAAYWSQRGWSSRGGRFAGETAKRRLQAMRRAFEQAARDLDASLALSPRPQLSHRYLISIAMARGERAKAGEWYAASLKSDPHNYASRRAALNALRPEWGGSLADMSRVIAEAEAAPQTRKQRLVVRHLKAAFAGYRALEAERARDIAGALALYDKALAETADPVLLENRGRLLVQQKRLDDALRDFNRALALDPNSADALQRRGNLHEQRGEIKETVRDYARAASYGSTYAMRRLGMLQLEQGNDREALRWLGLGAEFGDDNAQMALGYLYSAARGVPQDPRKAYDLWKLSAAQGNKQAKKYLDDLPWWWKARFAVEDWYSR